MRAKWPNFVPSILHTLVFLFVVFHDYIQKTTGVLFCIKQKIMGETDPFGFDLDTAWHSISAFVLTFFADEFVKGQDFF